MTVSLLTMLTAAPQPGLTADGGNTEISNLEDGQETEISFEDMLSDSGGYELDTSPQDIPQPELDLPTELVPNLVLAQAVSEGTLEGDNLEDTLRITGDLEKDFAQMTQLPLDAEQSADLAETIEQFLQRPDAGVVLTAAQRNVLFSMAAKLKQAALSDTPQTIKATLATLDTQLPAQGGKAQERSALMGQVMKWIGQVLRGGQPQAVPVQTAVGRQTSNEDAPGRGVALQNVPFPIPALDEAAPEGEAGGEIVAGAEAEDALALTPDAGLYPAVYVPPMPEVTYTEVPTDAAGVLAVDLPEVVLPSDDAELPEQAEGDEELLRGLIQMAAAQGKPVAQRQQSGVDLAKLNLEAHVPTDGMSATLPTPFNPEMDAEQAAELAPAAGSPLAAALTEGSSSSPLIEKVAPVTSSIEGITVASVNQNTPAPQPAQSTQAAPHTAHTPHVPRSDLLEQVHVGIKQAAFEGVDKITIQLQPMELGRVDVQIEVGREGSALIRFAADKPETLDQLQKDARILERALQEAGVKADAGSMEFNLRQGQGHAAMWQNDQGFGESHQHGLESAETGAVSAAKEPSAESGTGIAYSLTLDQGLDIRV